MTWGCARYTASVRVGSDDRMLGTRAHRTRHYAVFVAEDEVALRVAGTDVQK